jgi:uncharacterized membrane protein
MDAQGIVSWVLPVHVLGGGLALAFGYVALFAAKGAALHRKSGTLFVVAMVAMSLSGAFIAFLNWSAVSVIAGLLTFYFVSSSLLTVRRRTHAPDWKERGAMLFAVAVAMLAFVAGIEASRRGRTEAAPMFVFGIVGVLAAVGDLRMIRARGIQGPRRIARHLWRMCFAMWVAAASFFWGPPGRVPELINIPALLPIPVLLPVVTMIYWLWRLRVKAPSRGKFGARAPDAAVFAAPEGAAGRAL